MQLVEPVRVHAVGIQRVTGSQLVRSAETLQQIEGLDLTGDPLQRQIAVCRRRSRGYRRHTYRTIVQNISGTMN